MKKKILLLMGVFVFGILKAQVGINISNPQGVFHIDGGRDNSASPTASQQLNDVAVLNNGNVGIGMTNPSAKLVIEDGATVASPKYVLKITDGNEGKDKVITSVDNQGRGTWQSLPFETNMGIVYGTTTFPAQTVQGTLANLINGFSYTITRSGYYAFDIRWWGNYTLAGTTSVGAETATHFYLHKNGVTVDQFEAYTTTNITDVEVTTVSVPLYSYAVVGDVFTLSVRPGFIPIGADVTINNDGRAWINSKVRVVLMDL